MRKVRPLLEGELRDAQLAPPAPKITYTIGCGLVAESIARSAVAYVSPDARDRAPRESESDSISGMGSLAIHTRLDSALPTKRSGLGFLSRKANGRQHRENP